MKIITLSNEKGGVGKTTLTMHIAMGLAYRGQRVMLIDSDSQGNSTERCGIAQAPGLYDLVVRDAEWKDVVRTTDPAKYGIPNERVPDQGVLYVVPSNIETRNIATSVSDATILIQRLHEIESMVDVVLIDTSPTPSLLHGSIYLATDYIIYPTTCTIDSFKGLGMSMEHRKGADYARENRLEMPGIKIMGIVPTLYRGNTVEQMENLKTLNKTFGARVWNPMPLRTIWTETESQRAAVWTLDPSHPAAGDAWEIVDNVEKGLTNDVTSQTG